MASSKLSKNQFRRQRAKEKRSQLESTKQVDEKSKVEQPKEELQRPIDDYDVDSLAPNDTDRNALARNSRPLASDIDILLQDNPEFAAYKAVLDKFNVNADIDNDQPTNKLKPEDTGDHIFYSDDEEKEADLQIAKNSGGPEEDGSKRKKAKVPIIELKREAKYPQLVEWFDADAPDPRLVIQIKSAPFVVQVPDNWQSKREYLASRRGVHKAPYNLPESIRRTGIMDMRDALNEDTTLLRQQMRERVQPKMGRLDIDYQKLHDAFFKNAEKPRLFRAGDVYYDGKERELDTRDFRPGVMSNRLRHALHMGHTSPPPWLAQMQRYGPPPSYPGIKIPGVNAPIPAGAQWGVQSGQWGKPFIDANGKSLADQVVASEDKVLQPSNKVQWGQMIDDEESDQEEEEEEEGEVADDNEAEFVSDAAPSYAKDDEDDSQPEPRKRPASPPPTTNKRQKLFQVLEESKTDSSGFMGRGSAYNIPSNLDAELDNLLAESQRAVEAKKTRKQRR